MLMCARVYTYRSGITDWLFTTIYSTRNFLFKSFSIESNNASSVEEIKSNHYKNASISPLSSPSKSQHQKRFKTCTRRFVELSYIWLECSFFIFVLQNLCFFFDHVSYFVFGSEFWMNPFVQNISRIGLWTSFVTWIILCV